MTRPMDPFDYQDDNEPTEFSWGLGLFPPGIADGEGQTHHQDDFGDNMIPNTAKIGDKGDNYARAVADRRTDPTDPESGRDFESCGNPDRYGGQPPLIRAEPQPNTRRPDPFEPKTGVKRKW
jgi:hypothetical protein